MKKWEYNEILKTDRISNQDLNDYGNNGWELVSYNHVLNSDHVYIFKRPKNE